MRNFFLYLCFLLVVLSCKNEKTSNLKEIEDKKDVAKTDETVQEKVPTLDYTGLKPFLNRQDDKIYVVNFWATWCAPCVKELPYFEKVNQEYKDQNVEVLLVSLDFPKKKESKLIPFIKEKNIQSKVIHFDDRDEQFWIPDINESWTGALPATLIYNKNQRKFFEKSFTQEELENEIKSFIN